MILKENLKQLIKKDMIQIVLVNEDVNSYLQGTLLFYDLNNPEVNR